MLPTERLLALGLTSRLRRGTWRRIICHMAERLSDDTFVGRLANFLGGRAVLKKAVRSRLDLVPLVRAGLPYEALEAVGSRLHLSAEFTAASLLIPDRTIARRKASGRLDAHESERVVRLADVAARAAEIFGESNAYRWLSEPNQSLGGATPMDLLDTDLGGEAVKDILGRIEHGVIS